MKKRAFTLIEMSIVLVILGLLVGGSFEVLKVMRERSQISRAKDDVKTAKEAIIGNAAINDNTLPSGSYFQQNLSPVKNNQHPLFYADDTNLESKNICAFVNTNLKVETPDKTIPDIAFVVASESANHNMQTALTDNHDGTYSVKTHKYSENVDDNTSPVNIAENYDDIVEWVTLAQLQEALRCSDNPLRIVNTSMPSTNIANIASYNAKIVIDGNFSAPTSDSCSFTPSNSGFQYNNFVITHDNTPGVVGTVQVDCSVTADGKSVSKKFVITINDSNPLN